MSDFRVQGKLGLDGAGFFSTLNKAQGAAMKLGTMLAGAFSIGAITSFSRSVLDLAGKLRQVSEALNINVEFLQKFVNSTATSGGSLEAVEKFFTVSMKNRQMALDSPDGAQGKAFKRLGFSQDDISNLNPQQFMERLIESFKNGADGEALAALVQIGGEAASKLVGGFKAGLDEATLIMEEGLVNELEEISAKFTSLGTDLKIFFAPALKAVADGVGYFLNKVQQFQEMFGAFFGRIFGDAASGGTSIPETLKKAFQEAIDAQTKTEAEQSEKAARNAESKAAASEARREQQQRPTGLTAAEKTEKEKATKAATIASDSRIAVGGFLGQGASMALGAIAERQLQVARQTLLVQRDILNAINSMSNLKSSLVIPL
jgi:hypothetical protein